jgi:hypothetical protein
MFLAGGNWSLQYRTLCKASTRPTVLVNEYVNITDKMLAV